MPGFAVGSLRGVSGVEGAIQPQDTVCNTKVDGQTIWLAKKPNAIDEEYQDPALCVFNGATPILPGKIGRGTFDYPARALHLGRTVLINDEFPATAVGLKADSWRLWESDESSAFVSLGYDATFPLSRGVAPTLERETHAIWVNPRTKVSSLALSRSGGSLVAAGGVIAPTNPALTSILGAGLLQYNSTGQSAGTFTALVDATWWFSASGTLSSTSEEATVLRMTLQRDGDDTYLTGHRLQSVFRDLDYYNDIGADPYTTADDVLTPSPYNDAEPFYTAENVAFSGPLQLSEGDVIRVVNKSLVPMLVGDFIFSAFLVGRS